jgi:hypothetical protein
MACSNLELTSEDMDVFDLRQDFFWHRKARSNTSSSDGIRIHSATVISWILQIKNTIINTFRAFYVRDFLTLVYF